MMDDVLRLAERKRRTSDDKDKVRIAVDFAKSEYEMVRDFCDRHNVSASKLAKVLLLRYIESKESKK